MRWGIAVNRTELITFPWDGQILDDPKDFDFDYQPLVGIRVNEPVAIYSTSADGKYFQVSTSCCTYRDPNAGTTVTIDYSTFEKSFTELGGRIVYYAFQH